MDSVDGDDRDVGDVGGYLADLHDGDSPRTGRWLILAIVEPERLHWIDDVEKCENGRGREGRGLKGEEEKGVDQ